MNQDLHAMQEANGRKM